MRGPCFRKKLIWSFVVQQELTDEVEQLKIQLRSHQEQLPAIQQETDQVRHERFLHRQHSGDVEADINASRLAFHEQHAHDQQLMDHVHVAMSEVHLSHGTNRTCLPAHTFSMCIHSNVVMWYQSTL